jgi:hypothetical protein
MLALPLVAGASAFEPVLGNRSLISGFAGSGLIQTPTARLVEGGEISLFNMRSAPYRHMGLVLGVHPRVEATVRYSDVEDVTYGFGRNQGYKDKGLNLRILVAREDLWRPAIAVGIHDLGGTNLFSGEYVVASKRLGRFDATLGLGWGRVGARGGFTNPLSQLSDRFDVRDGESDQGGTVTFGNFFSGPEVGLFGGVSYQTDIEGLTLIAEYDGNDYSVEKSPTVTSTSPWNFGASYHLNDNVELRVGRERGEVFSAGIALKFNVSRPSIKEKLDPAPELLIRADSHQTWLKAAEQSGFEATTVDEEESVVTLRGEFTRHVDRAKGLGVLATTLLPALQGKDLAVVETQHGLDLKTWQVPYATSYGRLDGALDARDIEQQVTAAEPVSNSYARGWNWDWSLRPDLDQFFHTTEDFVVYRAQIRGDARVTWNERTQLAISADYGLIDNYDNQVDQVPTTSLPIIRTDSKDYLRKAAQNLRINSLALSHAQPLARNWYGLAYAGLLESQFAGMGAEVFYQPLNEPFAFGLDVNYAKKREPGVTLGLRNYSTVTGHATLYYRPLGQSFGGSIAVGRYLAKDVGATLRAYHQFENGAQIGGWATKTDVSAAEFGEGSFDKGLFVKVPFNVFSARSTVTNAQISWRPMYRDGGAMLGKPVTLQSVTQNRGKIPFNASLFGTP